MALLGAIVAELCLRGRGEEDVLVEAWLAVARSEASARWRALRERLQAAPLLAALQQQDLFGGVQLHASSIEGTLPPASAGGGVAFAIYHKTGVVFTTNLLRLLAPGGFLQHADYNLSRAPGGAILGAPWRFALAASGSQAERPGASSVFGAAPHVVVEPSAAWPVPGRMRVVHWYRDPAALILSAYRYHSRFQSLLSETPAWHEWTAACLFCDGAALEAIFQACDFRCSYFDLLNSVDERTGVLMEGARSRQTLRQMLAVLNRTANDPNVLHLSIEHVRSGPRASMRCLFRFLGAGDAQADAAIGHLELRGALLPARPKRHTRGPGVHATFDKYNNSDLRAFLLRHPVWGPPLARLRRAARAVFARQSRLYGCPIPRGV